MRLLSSKSWLPIIAGSIMSVSVQGQKINPDSTASAMKLLAEAKSRLSDKTDLPSISKMMELGMWYEAVTALRALPGNVPAKLLWADYYILQNEFNKSEKLVTGVIAQQPLNEKAVLLKAYLEIQAWELLQAEQTCRAFLKKNPSSDKAMLMLGRTLLLQKRYKEAMTIAKNLEKKDSENAAAFRLEADVFFWNQEPDKAEAPLKKSLELDPFNADARFSYGYAIWRRIDATQLNAMAAQWEIALAVNPLHFQTHWHWGNGHTNLTYADYAAPDDEKVRTELKAADEKVRKNDIRGAIETTLEIEKKYPASVIPLLHRASVYYSAFEMDQQTRLDSSQAIFLRILGRITHYGPAHNGLSAVIKSKRIPYLRTYDSIMTSLKNTKISDPENFEKVFPDVAYYPGHLARAMVWNQMYTSIVYFPFLSKQLNSFRVPPLHIDLAVAMGQQSFRYMTTFDNRQWMDIRGVGSGAAAIEYVERGAFLERNVILHEYVHLFHGRVLTDQESREIRAHYYTAMKEKRTLDYYSQNNESEYFAQTYPAYFEPVKVHPLDFKSMNTTNDLKTKDPGMYAFLDKLVRKEKAYLAGDASAMASNWSQIYVNLSARARNSEAGLGGRYLDTALRYDRKYLPAFIAYAQLKSDAKDFSAATEWLDKAGNIDPGYAPVYSARARLVSAKQAAGMINTNDAVKEQAALYKKALETETDFQEIAGLNIQFREMYRRNGMMSESIEVAEAYGKSGSVISTYLRDRRDDAIAYAASIRAILGDSETVERLKIFVEQKPQNFEYRNLYADALTAHAKYDAAIGTIREAQRILSASGSARPDYFLKIAENYQAMGNKDSVSFYLQPFLSGKMRAGTDQLRYIRLLAVSGYISQADSLAKKMDVKGDDFYLSQLTYTKGYIAELTNDNAEAVRQYENALALNPYLPRVYEGLFNLYKAAGDEAKIKMIKDKLTATPLLKTTRRLAF
jgi:Tfp pilus assembly protein PilF